ncbi:MAG: hypothetical protein LC659_09670 [Myxococcales bacterium]|nr:hypothetical protein [Myxococcales bacterium]
MRLVRRVLVCLLVLVLVGETSGVARAIGPGTIVRCCCGAHATARPCPCPDCPVTLRRAAQHDVGAARLTAAHDCSGADAGDPGVLAVRAIAPASRDFVTAPHPRRFAYVFVASPVRTRAVDIGRPPP